MVGWRGDCTLLPLQPRHVHTGHVQAIEKRLGRRDSLHVACNNTGGVLASLEHWVARGGR